MDELIAARLYPRLKPMLDHVDSTNEIRAAERIRDLNWLVDDFPRLRRQKPICGMWFYGVLTGRCGVNRQERR
jgi:hypothetical protein